MADGTMAGGLLAAALLVFAVTVQADVFNMPSGQTSLQFVTVGNPGNAPDTQVMDDGTTGYGSVPYVYQMGKYDVTVGQYLQFLNAVATTSDPDGLYNSNMGGSIFPTFPIVQSGSPGKYSYAVTGTYSQGVNCPIFDVSWGAAARFCNWLQNGQPTGSEGNSTTETGAYTLDGATSGAALMAVTRNPGATYFLPTENEWYKAAYYVGGGTNAGYWLYPTQSNSVPSNLLSAAGKNNANYYSSGYSDPSNGLTPVGAFSASPGPYGTYDMGGDVFQWNETAVTSSYRGFRGGAFDANASEMISSYREGAYYPYAAYFDIGFRVAALPQPANSVWANAVSGSWSSTGNWLGGVVPNAAGAGAVFNASTTAALTITLDSPQTVGTLQFGNSGSAHVGYTLSGSGSNYLTLNNSGSGATITVTGGSQAIDAPIVLADNLVVTTGGTTAWTLSFGTASSITDDGRGYSLTMNGTGGTLILSGSDTYSGGTNIDAGRLIITNNAALPDGSSLTVGSGGTLIFDPSLAGAATVSTLSAVPEPGSVLVLGVGAIGLLAYARRWRRGAKA